MNYNCKRVNKPIKKDLSNDKRKVTIITVRRRKREHMIYFNNNERFLRLSYFSAKILKITVNPPFNELINDHANICKYIVVLFAYMKWQKRLFQRNIK